MGKIALVFSGQGAQYTGMGKELYDFSPAAKSVFDIADSIRENTSSQCFNADISELSQTINTQPCVFTTNLAAAKAVEEKGIKVDCVAGFSLGEIDALTFAEVLTIEEGFKLVCKRGEYMDEACKENSGVMIAVMKLEAEKIKEICSKFNDTYPVNFNSPAQTVVATKEENAEAVEKAFTEERARVKRLAVSGAFHSPFMSKAAEKLENYLDSISLNQPQIPVYSNFTAKPYEDNIKELIKSQVENPVRWTETIENMINDGVDTFIEVGVGKTLTGLIKKINKEVKVVKVENQEDLQTLDIQEN